MPILKLPSLKVLDAEDLEFSSVDLSKDSENESPGMRGKTGMAGGDDDSEGEGEEAMPAPADDDDFDDDY